MLRVRKENTPDACELNVFGNATGLGILGYQRKSFSQFLTKEVRRLRSVSTPPV